MSLLASRRSIVPRPRSLVGELHNPGVHLTQPAGRVQHTSDLAALRDRQPAGLPAPELLLIDIAALDALAVDALDPCDRRVIQNIGFERARRSVAYCPRASFRPSSVSPASVASMLIGCQFGSPRPVTPRDATAPRTAPH